MCSDELLIGWRVVQSSRGGGAQESLKTHGGQRALVSPDGLDAGQDLLLVAGECDADAQQVPAGESGGGDKTLVSLPALSDQTPFVSRGGGHKDSSTCRMCGPFIAVRDTDKKSSQKSVQR